MRRRASEAALVFNETFGGFDDAEGDRADHGHNKLPDVFQLGLPNAGSFLGTLEQLLSDSCVSAFRRWDDSDRLSVAGAFSETDGPAWF